MARRPTLGAIFLTVFLDILGFSLVLPFLAEEARDTFGTSELVGSSLAAVYSLMQFLFVPVWGRVSDRVGRRPVLVWSVAATGVGMLGLAGALVFGRSVAWLFAARIWGGIATANLGTASAYIADVTTPEERSKGMGLIGVAFGLGFILGPALGGALSSVPIAGRHGAVPCLIAAALSMVNLAWVAVGLGESLPKDARSRSTRRLVPLDLVAARETFALPGVGAAILVNFVAIAAFTNLDQTFRYFNKDLFGMTAMETGAVLAFIGVTAALVQGGLIRPLAKRFHEAPLIRAGALVQAMAFTIIAVAPSFGRGALYVGGAVLAVGNGLSQPSLSAYVSRRADRSSQGQTLGTNQSMASLARMVGPAMGGFLYGHVGPRSPYFAAAAGMALALVLALRLRDDSGAGAAVAPTNG